MKNSIRFFIFLIFSILEIRVRATTPLLQKPENCLNENIPCTFGTIQSVFNFKKEDVKLDLDKETIVTKLDSKSFEFIKGTVRVVSQNQTSWKLGTATVIGEGEYWILDRDNKSWVRAVLGDCEVKFGNEKIQVPEGFEMWLGGTGSDGKKVHSVPQVFKMSDHLKAWNRMNREPKKEFLDKVENLKVLYKNNVELSSQIYKEVALRHLASEERKKAIQEEKRRQKILEQEKLRRSYFQKVFEQ